MKNIILVISLFVCGHANAYQNKDFEDKYNDLAKTMERSGTWALTYQTDDKSESINLFCLSTQDAINFLDYISDNYNDYKEMLKNADMTALPKVEFEEMKIKRLTEIEGYKKDLVGTVYNCSPE
ncbi:hypothetical protein [Acinetobacter guillouiae]|uniref:hypothetical protein n=1 Tax=Acinetobacter guillouiae TaxID=106649 RepID=UPI003C6EE6FD